MRTVEKPIRRQSSIGCLGLLAALTLTTLTAVLLILLLWMNPGWLDRFAWWRAPLVGEPTVLSRLPEDAAALDAILNLPETPPEAPPRHRDGPDWIRLHSIALTADYTPTEGALLEGPNGLRLEVPPGGLETAGRLTLTPVAKLPAAMDGGFIGPVFDLRFDGRVHFRFTVPATLSLPFVAGLETEGATLFVWEDDHWTPVPSRLDRNGHTLSASIDHASIWSVGVLTSTPESGGLLPAGLFRLSMGMAKGALKSVLWTADEGYETPDGNFQFHFATRGPHRVPTDQEYLARIGKPLCVPYIVPKEGIPLYVQDLGYILEFCRHKLSVLGLPLPAPDVFRHDVFLESLESAYGSSGLGGPVILNARLDLLAAADGLALEGLIRAVCAHELVHVAQGEGHSNAMALAEKALPDGMGPRRRWWIEMCAEYIANFMWEEVGEPLGEVADHFQNDPRLPVTRMIGAPDPQHYAYAGFLHWLDQTQGRGKALEWILRVDKGWWADPTRIDAAARTVFGGSGLAELFRAFAFDFYHHDLQEGARFPHFHRNRTLGDQFREQSIASLSFMVLGVRIPLDHRNPEPLIPIVDTGRRSYRSHDFGPLSAQSVYFLFDGLPEGLRAKLVLMVNGPSTHRESFGLHLASGNRAFTAARAIDSPLPLGHATRPPESVPLTPSGKAVTVIDHLGEEDGPNCATLIAMNRSLSEDIPPIMVSRWLLLPPTYIEFSRIFNQDSLWQLKWPEADLKKTSAFKTYRIFAKPAGASDEAFKPIGDTLRPSFAFDAPDLDEREFTVRVVDTEDNESHNAPVADIRFAGIWSGTVRLTRGSVVTGLQSSGSPRWAESALERFPLGEIPFLRGMAAEAFLRLLEQGLKVGMPVRFEIRDDQGNLEARLLDLGGLDTGANFFLRSWYPLERTDLARADFRDLPKGVAGPVLRMHRDDPLGIRPAEIRCEDWRLRVLLNPDDPSGGSIDARFSLSCTRGAGDAHPLLSWLLK